MECAICLGENMACLGVRDFLVGGQEAIYTKIYLCLQCGSLHRQTLSDELLYVHFLRGAYYTDVRKAREWWAVRGAWLKKLFEIISRNVDSDQHKILDVGCSYGHLLRIFRDHGWETYGVELSPFAAAFARHEFGLTIFDGYFEDTQFPEKSFDVVTMIDTLYYVRDPLSILRLVHRILKPEGLLVIRNINRTFLAKIWYLLLNANIVSTHAEVPRALIGDAITAPSVRGMRLLLGKAGFSEPVFCSDSGQGKQMKWQHRALYLLAHALWLASHNKILISPGIVILARKINLDALR